MTVYNKFRFILISMTSPLERTVLYILYVLHRANPAPKIHNVAYLSSKRYHPLLTQSARQSQGQSQSQSLPGEVMTGKNPGGSCPLVSPSL